MFKRRKFLIIFTGLLTIVSFSTLFLWQKGVFASSHTFDQLHYRWRNDDGGENEISPAWWDSAWKHRKKIMFDTTGTPTISSNLANFPVRIELTPSIIDYTKTNNGNSLRFIDNDGATILPYEIEKWDEAGTSIIWAKVGQLDAGSVNDFVWMYYKNDTALSCEADPVCPDAINVWDSSHVGVWHMDEGAGTVNADSTSDPLEVTKLSAGEPNPVTGFIDGAQDFDGVNDKNSCTDANCGGNTTRLDMGVRSWTTSAWIRRDGGIGSVQMITSKTSLNSGGHPPGWYMGFNSSNRLEGLIRTSSGAVVTPNSGTQITSTGVWYHVAIAWNRNGNFERYLNGVLDGGTVSITVTSGSDVNNAQEFRMGARHPTSGTSFAYFNGAIDEARVADTNRSASWIAAEFRSTNPSSTFYTYEAEQTYPSATWAATEDTAITLAQDSARHLRFLVNSGVVGGSPAQFKMQFAPLSGSCGASAYGDVPVAPGTSAWHILDSTWLTDGVDTTDIDLSGGDFTDPPSKTFFAGKVMDTSNTSSSLSLTTSQFTVLEYSLKATTNATPSTTYCFRLVDNDGIPATFQYTAYAQATIASSGFPPSGSIESPIFDTGATNGVTYNWLMWKGISSPPGIVRLQLATASCSNGGNDLPTCTAGWTYRGGSTCGTGDYYTLSVDTQTQIKCFTNHNNKQYFRYKAQLCSTGDCVTGGAGDPQVYDVLVNWAP